MSSYVSLNLTANKKIIHESKVSKISLFFFAIGIIILYLIINQVNSGIAVLLLIIGFINIFIIYHCTELGLTNKRIITKYGFIRRRTVELNLSQIEAVYIKQGIFARIFNYGTIVISGSGSAKAKVRYIADPLLFKNLFFQTQEKHNED